MINIIHVYTHVFYANIKMCVYIILYIYHFYIYFLQNNVLLDCF